MNGRRARDLRRKSGARGGVLPRDRVYVTQQRRINRQRRRRPQKPYCGTILHPEEEPSCLRRFYQMLKRSYVFKVPTRAAMARERASWQRYKRRTARQFRSALRATLRRREREERYAAR